MSKTTDIEVISDTVAEFQRRNQVQVVLIVVGTQRKSRFKLFAAYHGGIEPDEIRKAYEAAALPDYGFTGYIGVRVDDESAMVCTVPVASPNGGWGEWASDYLKHVANTAIRPGDEQDCGEGMIFLKPEADT